MIQYEQNAINNFQKIISAYKMSSNNNTQTMQLQPLLSSSMEQRLNGSNNMFNSIGKQSSFGFVNIFDKSQRFDNKLKNSLQLLSSNAIYSQKPALQNKDIMKLNDQQKNRIQLAGGKPIQIGQAVSDSQQQQLFPRNHIQQSSHAMSYETPFNQETYKPNNYLPPELEQILKQKQIPLEYVKGLLLVKDKNDVKSVRRLKVERYLQKRRNKTWNRKICYNCRQKVAEERLRIKGKFIKKRRAMQLLGLTKPIPLAQLKKLLQEKLCDKTHAQIQELIKRKG